MSKRFPIVFTEAEHKALRMAAAAAETTMTEFVKAAITEKIACQIQSNLHSEASKAPALQQKGSEGD